MPFIVKGSGSDFPNIPPAKLGAHNAVLCEVYDRGQVQDKSFGGKSGTRHKAWLIFQVEELITGTGGDFDGKRKEVRITFNVGTLDPRSTIRQVLESWRGGPLSQEEVDDGFDVEKLVGVPALIIVGTHSKPDANGRCYANVSGVNPPEKQLEIVGYVPIDERKKGEEEEESDLAAGATGGKAQGKVPF